MGCLSINIEQKNVNLSVDIQAYGQLLLEAECNNTPIIVDIQHYNQLEIGYKVEVIPNQNGNLVVQTAFICATDLSLTGKYLAVFEGRIRTADGKHIIVLE